MKKTIDDWLFWAYRDQLPLLAPDEAGPDEMRGGWDKVGSWSVGGTNRYGVVHALDQRGTCSYLAMALADCVQSLDAVQVSLPEGWNPCEDFDMAALGPEGQGLAARAYAVATIIDRNNIRRLKRPVSDLVRRYALTGATPEWECDSPVRDMERRWNGEPRWFVKRRVMTGQDAFGQPLYSEVEQEGWDAKRRKPAMGAYRRYVLRPDPVPALVSRAEYEVLHAALAVLVDEWPGSEVCLPTRLPPRPWLGPPAARPRILEIRNNAA